MKRILLLLAFCFSFLLIGCNNESNFDKVTIDNIEGTWYVNNESEYIDFMSEDALFEMNDWEVFGNYYVDEDDNSKIMMIYEDLEGNSYEHYMYLINYVGGANSIQVEGCPLHENERVILYKKDK